MFNIVYEPRVEDEVVVATFAKESDANEYMDKLAEINPNVLPYHRIVYPFHSIKDITNE